MKIAFAATVAAVFATSALADGHAAAPMIDASNQDVSSGIVTAATVLAGDNGWLVVHRTDDSGKPGPVVGHAPLRQGENSDVAAILTEAVHSGDKLMLMVHSEAGGTKQGIFEYTLGAKEDGPIKPDGNLVMKVISAN